MVRKMPPNVYVREKTFYARFRIHGDERRQSLFIDDDGTQRALKEASKRAQQLKKEALQQRATPLSDDRKWEDLVEEWLCKRPTQNEKTILRYQVSLRHWGPFLEGRPVAEISTKILRALAKERQKEVSNATLQRDFTALSNVFEYAVEEDWTEENPVCALRTKSFRERRYPMGIPDETSMEIFFDNAPNDLAIVCLFALETGMRQSEIAALEWRSFDGLENAATLIKTKGKSRRTIEIGTRAAKIIANAERKNDDPFVFRKNDGEIWTDISSKFCGIRRRIESEFPNFIRFRFHDFRHLFAVNYLRSGGDIYALQQLMGHRSIKTTEIYLEFLTPEQRRIAKFGARAQKRAQ